MALVVCLVVLAVVASRGYSADQFAPAVVNMNGEYTIANPGRHGALFNSNYSARPAEYFDVYSPDITSHYGYVYW